MFYYIFETGNINLVLHMIFWTIKNVHKPTLTGDCMGDKIAFNIAV